MIKYRPVPKFQRSKSTPFGGTTSYGTRKKRKKNLKLYYKTNNNKMRNIYNLITDAFNRMGVDEINYTVKVQGNYVIEIKPRNNATNVKATLYLDLTATNEIYDVTYRNTLFPEQQWVEFCSVFTDAMPQVNNEAQLISFLNTLINQ